MSTIDLTGVEGVNDDGSPIDWDFCCGGCEPFNCTTFPNDKDCNSPLFLPIYRGVGYETGQWDVYGEIYRFLNAIPVGDSDGDPQ